MTQETAVIDFMEKHDGITAAQAMFNLHISRLAAVICRLRKDGIEISDEYETSKTPYGTARYKRYRLCEKTR